MSNPTRTTLTLYVCPVHGPLSERELEDASETVHEYMPIDGDGMGEPYRCPIWIRDNTPPRRAETRIAPGHECMEALECVEYEKAARS